MKVLLTGHHGYIGSVAGPLLRAAGHEVTGLDNYSTGRSANLATCATNLTATRRCGSTFVTPIPARSPATTPSSTSPRSRTTRWATSAPS